MHDAQKKVSAHLLDRVKNSLQNDVQYPVLKCLEIWFCAGILAQLINYGNLKSTRVYTISVVHGIFPI